MNLFPLEIVHLILEYAGKIKYRNGKYMNQIAQDDDRYKMLQTIPQTKLINGRSEYWYMILQTNHKMYGMKISSNYSGENALIDICIT